VLPSATNVQDDDRIADVRSREHTLVRAYDRRVRMLLIAADARSRIAFHESAGEASVALDCASGLTEAGELSTVWSYDVVFVDLQGSVHDRMSLTQAVRWKFPVARMVVVDAWSGAEERVAALHAGADEILGKPLEVEELSAKMRAMDRGERLPPSVRSELVVRPWKPHPFGVSTVRVETPSRRGRGGPRVPRLTHS
jgi:DNA-binding response OmpR family regulator